MTRAATGSAHHKPNSAFDGQAHQQYGRKVSAEFRLSCICAHGGASQSTTYFSFCVRGQRHHDQRHTRKHDSWNAVLRYVLRHQTHSRVVSDVGGKQEKAGADDSQRVLLVPLAAIHIQINRQPPQQHRTGGHFNEAVESETHQRDAAGKQTRGDAHHTLNAIPRHREMFNLRPSRTAARRSSIAVSIMHLVYNL